MWAENDKKSAEIKEIGTASLPISCSNCFDTSPGPSTSSITHWKSTAPRSKADTEGNRYSSSRGETNLPDQVIMITKLVAYVFSRYLYEEQSTGHPVDCLRFWDGCLLPA